MLYRCGGALRDGADERPPLDGIRMDGWLMRPPEPEERAVDPLEDLPDVFDWLVEVVEDSGSMTRDGGPVRTVTAPSFDTCFATLRRSPTLPRVTPNPAESRVMVMRRGGAVCNPVTGPRPTLTTVAVRFGGATGARKRFGGFTTRGIEYQLFQPPGCQNHP